MSAIEIFISVIAAGGGAITITYLALKSFAEKFIDSRFERSLQQLKQEHEFEVERLRLKMSTMLDKAVKINQREFEVLPDAWMKINEAYYAVDSIVSPLTLSADVDRMLPQQQEEFIYKCNLEDWQKSELLRSSRKSDLYRQYSFTYRASKCMELSRAAYRHIKVNGIFLRPAFKDGLINIHTLTWNALVEFQVNIEEEYDLRQYSARKEFTEKAKSLIDMLEGEIHAHIGQMDI